MTAEIANAVYDLFFARRPARDSAEWIERDARGRHRRCWTRHWRSGPASATRSGMGKALWGLSEWYGYRGDFARAEDTATQAIEIFERIGDPFWVSWSRFTRAFGRVMGGDLPGARARPRANGFAFWDEPRPFGPGARPVGRHRSLLLLVAPSRSRGTRWAAPHAASWPRRACTSSTLWPSRGDTPSSTPTPRIPSSRAAISRGNAWSRDEAVERDVANAAESPPGGPDRRPPERRRMAVVHVPESPAAAPGATESSFTPIRLVDDEPGPRGRRGGPGTRTSR